MLTANDDPDELTSWIQILERIVEQSDNMVVITDRDQRVKWVNRTYTHITGWTLDEVRGQKAGAVLNGPLTDARVGAAMGKRLRAGQSVTGIEIINYRKSGEAYVSLLNIEPIRDRQGRIAAYFSIQSDVTERRTLEQSNLRLQHQLQEAQALAKLGRIARRGENNELEWTVEVCDLLEIERSVVRGSIDFLTTFIDRRSRRRVPQMTRQHLESGEAIDLELPVITAKGKRRWVRCRALPVVEHQGYRPPETWTVQDVSVYRELIEQKRQTNERLQAMVQERTQHLEEANRSLEAFSHALSHDLKKPVRHMVSFAEITRQLMASGDTDQALAYADKVVAAGIRLQHLIEGMLGFCRMGRNGIDPSPVDLRGLVSDCLAEAASSFPACVFTARGLADLPVVHADPVLIRDVWSNLLDNAFKYSQMRPEIELEFGAKETPEGWTVFLRDNGCGFAGHQQDAIFAMFSRAVADDSIQGDGIGLAMCRRIVQAHGGKIWAESRQGEGSTFFVHLPRHPRPSGFGELQLKG